MEVSNMPTAEDLRLIARYAFEELRDVRPATGRGALNDLRFVADELTILGAKQIYDEEYRRHELAIKILRKLTTHRV